MEEDKKTIDEKTKEEPTSDNTGEGIQQETTSELDRADSIAERQKRENDRREALLTREEALAARKAVGGVTEAGQTPAKKEEISNSDYASEVMKGNNPDGKA